MLQQKISLANRIEAESIEKISFNQPEVGSLFQRAREHKGLSLDDISRKLHIRACYLRAIEDDQIDKLPGEWVYRTGFIRTYARFLELDGQEIIRQLLNQQEKSLLVIEATDRFTTSLNLQGSPSLQPSLHIVKISLLSSLLLIAGLSVWHYTDLFRKPLPITFETPSHNSFDTDIEPFISSSIDYKQTMKAVFPVIEQRSKINNYTVNSHKHLQPQDVFIHIQEPTWLEIYDSDMKPISKRGFHPPESLKLPLGTILTVGNAASLRAIIGDMDVKKLGKKGQVIKNLVLDTSVLKGYLLKND